MALGTEMWKSTKAIYYVLVSFNQITLYAYLFIYMYYTWVKMLYIYLKILH